MLLHVIMTHSEDNCPGYDGERLAKFLKALEKKDELAKKFNIKLHYLVSAAPKHDYYALLEVERIEVLSRFLFELMPVPHKFEITPVQKIEDLITTHRR